MAFDTNLTNFRPNCILDYVYANLTIDEDKLTTFGCSSMYTWEIVITIFVLSLIIIVTIVGNVLVILSVVTYKPLNTVQNYFISSLAIADLTVAFLVMPQNVMYITIGRWVLGSIPCQIWLTFDILCCTASILNLTAIALDRYWAITDPIEYANKRNSRLVFSMISCVWIFSIIICMGPLFGWNDWPPEFTIQEPCKLTENRSFVLFSSMGSFFIPSVLIFIVYAKIFFAIRRRTRKRAEQSKINRLNKLCAKPEDSVFSDNGHNGMKENGNKESKFCSKNQCLLVPNNVANNCSLPGSDNSRRDGSASDHDGHQEKEPLSPKSLHPDLKTIDVIVQVAPGGINQINQFVEERQKISLSKERKAATTLGIIVGVFIICWMPFFLMYVIRPFCPQCPVISERVENVIVWLGYANSALNPLIYTIFNIEFRRAFSKFLWCSISDV